MVLTISTVKSWLHQLWPACRPFNFRSWPETAPLHQRSISQFQREPVNDCYDTLYLTFYSDLERETRGTKLNISIKGINLARCFWFTPTIYAQKKQAKTKKGIFIYLFIVLSQQLIKSVNQNQWWGLLTKTQIGGWRETNGLSENQ